MNTTKITTTEEKMALCEVEPSELCSTNGGVWDPGYYDRLVEVLQNPYRTIMDRLWVSFPLGPDVWF